MAQIFLWQRKSQIYWVKKIGLFFFKKNKKISKAMLERERERERERYV